MNIKITPKKLSGSISGIDSKSHAHRLLIAYFLANLQNPSQKCLVNIHNSSMDISATKRALEALLARKNIINCGESGSTLRFLFPIAAALNTISKTQEKIIFTGEGKLPLRPLTPLDDQLASHGCSVVKFAGNSKKICEVSGKLTGGSFSLPGNISSQFVTGLLFALPLLHENSEIRITSEMQSKSYIDLTLDVLKSFSIETEKTEFGYKILGNQKYICPSTVLEPEKDWSQASFWLVANALGSDIEITNLDNNSVQGDKSIIRLINLFRENRPDNFSLCNNEQKYIKQFHQIDAGNIPDLVPVLSVLAAFSPGATTVIKNAARLRIKESDRIKTTCAMISGLGGEIKELPDGMIIKGKQKLKGGITDGANDHRIIMAAAIAAVCTDSPVKILGAEAVNKSYPDFFKDYAALGGSVTII